MTTQLKKNNQFLHDLAWAMTEDERFLEPDLQKLIESASYQREDPDLPGPWTAAVLRKPVSLVVAVQRDSRCIGWLVLLAGGDNDLIAVNAAGYRVTVVEELGEPMLLLGLAAHVVERLDPDMLRKLLARSDFDIHGDLSGLAETHGRETLCRSLWALLEADDPLPLAVGELMTEQVPSPEVAAKLLARVGVEGQWQSYIGWAPMGTLTWDRWWEQIVAGTPEPDRLLAELDRHENVDDAFKEDVAFALARLHTDDVALPALVRYATAYLQSDIYDDWAFYGAAHLSGWQKAVERAWLQGDSDALFGLRPELKQRVLGATPVGLLLARLGQARDQDVATLREEARRRADLDEAFEGYVVALDEHITQTEELVGSVSDRSWVITDAQCRAVERLSTDRESWVAVAGRDPACWQRCTSALLERRARPDATKAWLCLIDEAQWEGLIAVAIERRPEAIDCVDLHRTSALEALAASIAESHADEEAGRVAQQMIQRWKRLDEAAPQSSAASSSPNCRENGQPTAHTQLKLFE